MRKNQFPENEPVPELSDELNAFADRLASFKPRSVGIDRDQLMFEAGQAAALATIHSAALATRRTLRVWQSAALMLTAVSAGLGSTMMLRSEREPRVVIVERDRPVIPVDESPSPSKKYVVPNSVAKQKSFSTQEARPVEPPSEIFSDLIVANLNAIEALRSRRLLIAQTFDSTLGSDRTFAGTDSPATSTDQSPNTPPLTSRSLNMGDQSRNWVNRLIQEPQL